MFISQVIFESEKENEEMIKKIMKKKEEDAKSAKDIVASEVWWKESKTTVGFTLVTKWNDKETFQNWLKESHSGGHGHKNADDSEARLLITKTGYQFTSVD